MRTGAGVQAPVRSRSARSASRSCWLRRYSAQLSPSAPGADPRRMHSRAAARRCLVSTRYGISECVTALESAIVVIAWTAGTIPLRSASSGSLPHTRDSGQWERRPRPSAFEVVLSAATCVLEEEHVQARGQVPPACQHRVRELSHPTQDDLAGGTCWHHPDRTQIETFLQGGDLVEV
jgi:hypothetical protein